MTAATAQEQSASHTIRVEAPESAVVGGWDRIRLSQVLENLVGNAIKHASEGCEFVIRIEEQDGEALVSVRDVGPGIAWGLSQNFAHLLLPHFRVWAGLEVGHSRLLDISVAPPLAVN